MNGGGFLILGAVTRVWIILVHSIVVGRAVASEINIRLRIQVSKRLQAAATTIRNSLGSTAMILQQEELRIRCNTSYCTLCAANA